MLVKRTIVKDDFRAPFIIKSMEVLQLMETWDKHVGSSRLREERGETARTNGKRKGKNRRGEEGKRRGRARAARRSAPNTEGAGERSSEPRRFSWGFGRPDDRSSALRLSTHPPGSLARPRTSARSTPHDSALQLFSSPHTHPAFLLFSLQINLALYSSLHHPPCSSSTHSPHSPALLSTLPPVSSYSPHLTPLPSVPIFLPFALSDLISLYSCSFVQSPS